MKEKIKVLQIAFNDLGNGGIQNQIMAIVRNTYEQVDNDVVVWNSKPEFYDSEFKEYGKIFIKPHYNGKSYLRRKLDFFTRYFRVKKAIYQVLIEEGPYDVVHSHKLFESAACLAAAYKAGVPVRIAHAHLTQSKGYKMTPVRFVIKCYNSVYRRLIRKYATHMIGCSRDAADYVFGKNYGDVVHIGIDLKRFDAQNYHAQCRETKRLLNVGSFSVHKNQLFLIDVFDELRKIRQDVDMVLVGKGADYKKQVEQKISEKGLSDHITLKPHDVSVPKEMSEADVFVFPSNFEGFGIVLIEAQSMGLKCFASTEVPDETNCGSVTYLDLADGPRKWAQEIDRFLNSDHSQTRDIDVSEFSEERMAERILAFYKQSTANPCEL